MRNRAMIKRAEIAVCALFACGLLAAALPGAAAAQKRVAVSEIKGRGGALVRGGAVKALKGQDEVELVSTGAVQDAAEKLGVDVSDGKKQISSELGIAVWIDGEVEKARRNVAVTLAVISGTTGETLGVVSYEAKNPKLLGKDVARSLWNDIADLVAQAEAPERAVATVTPVEEEEEEEEAKPEPEPEEVAHEDQPKHDEEGQDEDDTAQESEPDSDGQGPSPLDVGLAFVGFSRSFDYNDDLSGLRTYDLGLGPTVGLKLHWYPAAHFSDGFAANVGLELRGAFAFALDSALDDVSFPTSARTLGGGLRVRFPIGDHELAALAGLANQTFAIDKADDNGVQVEPGVPSTSYTYLRLGAELRFALGDTFAIGLAAAYLPVLSTGELEDDLWFPRASASGIEGEMSLSYALSPAFEVLGSVGLQRFAFSFDPKPEDVAANRAIAGGATDQYLSGTLGVRWRLGG
jgi:hypothetical protein